MNKRLLVSSVCLVMATSLLAAPGFAQTPAAPATPAPAAPASGAAAPAAPAASAPPASGATAAAPAAAAKTHTAGTRSAGREAADRAQCEWRAAHGGRQDGPQDQRRIDGLPEGAWAESHRPRRQGDDGRPEKAELTRRSAEPRARRESVTFGGMPAPCIVDARAARRRRLSRRRMGSVQRQWRSLCDVPRCRAAT